MAKSIKRNETLDDKLARVKFTYPVVKAAHLDYPLRQLMLAKLLEM
jgi:hypothetical protein